MVEPGSLLVRACWPVCSRPSCGGTATARRGRPTVQLTLSGDERKTLERWARRHSSSLALALRCRIVLACADSDRTNTAISADQGCSPATVSKWRHRFAQDRLDGLVDAPRPGAPRKIGDEVVEAIVIETLETAPDDATHWSTRDPAKKRCPRNRITHRNNLRAH